MGDQAVIDGKGFPQAFGGKIKVGDVQELRNKAACAHGYKCRRVFPEETTGPEWACQQNGERKLPKVVMQWVSPGLVKKGTAPRDTNRNGVVKGLMRGEWSVRSRCSPG